jgi:probable HAF family extracellular repeat protein
MKIGYAGHRIPILHLEHNMSRTTATDLSKRRLMRLVPCLLGGAVLAGTVGAQQPQAAGASAHYGAALPAAYRVINLSTGGIVSIPAINDRGQVAYTFADGLGGVRALFYDGTSIVEIDPLGGTPDGAIGLNNAGQVAGTAVTSGGTLTRAYVWTSSTGAVDLGTLGGPSAGAVDINNRGEVAGSSTTPTSFPHAFRWTAATGIEDLGILPGASFPSFTNATAISDSGLITGWGTSANGNGHAFAWTRRTGMIDLGTLGGSFSYAEDVNAQGQVVGYATVSGDLWHAFIWNRRSGMTDLGTGGGQESFAVAISDKGQVAGIINFPDSQRGFSWTRAGGLIRFGTLGGLRSSARDVNGKGQVVGGSNTRRGDLHAFVWTAREGLVDLNKRLRHAPAGLVLDYAFAISDNGSIVATSNAGLVLLKPDCGCPGTHAVGPIAVPSMVAAGTPFDSTVSFAGADTAARHHVTWSWGDGSGEQAGFARESNGAGHAIGSYTYKAPGIYTISARVTDLAGKSATVTRDLIVYDKAGATVRGSGSFVSTQGAGGKAGGVASFDLIAPSGASAKAAAATKGELRFRAGTLNFRSQNVKAVAVQGQQGRFEGSGTLNGSGDYRFALATMAGGAGQPGRFALKIWHLDPVTQAEVVDYDNLVAGPGNTGPAVQGSIVHQ